MSGTEEQRADRLRAFVARAYETGRVICAPNTFGAVTRILDALAPDNAPPVQIDVSPWLAPGTVLTGSTLPGPEIDR